MRDTLRHRSLDQPHGVDRWSQEICPAMLLAKILENHPRPKAMDEPISLCTHRSRQTKEQILVAPRVGKAIPHDRHLI